MISPCSSAATMYRGDEQLTRFNKFVGFLPLYVGALETARCKKETIHVLLL